MKMHKKIAKFIFVILTLIGIIFLLYYNIKNNPVFFDASVFEIISIAIALGVAYYLTQKKTDERKQKNNIEELLTKIQVSLASDVAYNIKDKKSIMMNVKYVENKITLLKRHCDKFEIQDKIKELEKQFDDYDTKIGDYIALDNLDEKDKLEIKRISNNIDDICDTIKIQLYG